MKKGIIQFDVENIIREQYQLSDNIDLMILDVGKHSNGNFSYRFVTDENAESNNLENINSQNVGCKIVKSIKQAEYEDLTVKATDLINQNNKLTEARMKDSETIEKLLKEIKNYKEAMKRLSEENYILKNTCKSNNDINTTQKTCSDNCKCKDEQKEAKNFSEFKKKIIDKADLGFLEFFLDIDEEKLKSLGIEVKRM